MTERSDDDKVKLVWSMAEKERRRFQAYLTRCGLSQSEFVNACCRALLRRRSVAVGKRGDEEIKFEVSVNRKES